ncbi:MAG TPA: Trm112 family protein [Syntrophorhabdaceae bacterium]|nr:Trm112 family protein [Syntrophorhabdaceae bacterium]
MKKSAISKELLEILCCPKCKGDLVLLDSGEGLVCRTCSLLYPIKDDIPVMLIEEALPAPPDKTE